MLRASSDGGVFVLAGTRRCQQKRAQSKRQIASITFPDAEFTIDYPDSLLWLWPRHKVLGDLKPAIGSRLGLCACRVTPTFGSFLPEPPESTVFQSPADAMKYAARTLGYDLTWVFDSPVGRQVRGVGAR